MSGLYTFILLRLFNLETQNQGKTLKEASWGEETECCIAVSLLCRGRKGNLIHLSGPEDAIQIAAMHLFI